VRVARIAQSAGVAALAVHGRTRACAFVGEVEYDTIAEVKSHVGIPVVANGDIDTPEKARRVLDHTGADAVMIGRAAQGRPWIFREIAHYLETGTHLALPPVVEIWGVLADHLQDLYAFYGEDAGVRIARKHIDWYTRDLAGSEEFRRCMNRLEAAQQQMNAVDAFFGRLAQHNERLSYWEEGLAA